MVINNNNNNNNNHNLNTTLVPKNRMKMPLQPSLFAFTAARESATCIQYGWCLLSETFHYPTGKEAKTHSSYTTKNSSRLCCVFRLRSRTYKQISFEKKKNFSHTKELYFTGLWRRCLAPRIGSIRLSVFSLAYFPVFQKEGKLVISSPWVMCLRKFWTDWWRVLTWTSCYCQRVLSQFSISHRC